MAKRISCLCPHCGDEFECSEALVGSVVRCPECGEKFTVERLRLRRAAAPARPESISLAKLGCGAFLVMLAIGLVITAVKLNDGRTDATVEAMRIIRSKLTLPNDATFPLSDCEIKGDVYHVVGRVKAFNAFGGFRTHDWAVDLRKTPAGWDMVRWVID